MRVRIFDQECLVTNEATFSGVKHYGIIFTILPQHQHGIVTESIGWVPATLCEVVTEKDLPANK